jgi:hypothetical protein
MIYLYGIREEREYGYGGWTGNRETIRELVATFDTTQDALDYVRDATLAAAKKPHFYPDLPRGKFTYKKDSLLRDYESCEIQDGEAEGIIPHNPTVAKTHRVPTADEMVTAQPMTAPTRMEVEWRNIQKGDKK